VRHHPHRRQAVPCRAGQDASHSVRRHRAGAEPYVRRRPPGRRRRHREGGDPHGCRCSRDRRGRAPRQGRKDHHLQVQAPQELPPEAGPPAEVHRSAHQRRQPGL
ncbi:MAG: LSU ribosomal protein L21p, partial [uncultured Gemmatimonadetes bacterium]